VPGWGRHGGVIAQSKRGALAGALRGWRARRRVSQLELALRAGTTQRHVSFIESGRSVPGRAMIVRLAELRLLTTLTHFGTAVDVTVAELRMEAFLPADEATAAILAKLVRQR
jgi:transcriptional regulator with XRE-family HTH domain